MSFILRTLLWRINDDDDDDDDKDRSSMSFFWTDGARAWSDSIPECGMLQLLLLQLPLVDLRSLSLSLSLTRTRGQLSHWPSTLALCSAQSPTAQRSDELM